MRKFFLLASLLLTTSSLFADLALPGELEPYISKTNYKNKDVNYSIEKIYNQKEFCVNLVAKNSNGEKVWESEIIGDSEKLVNIDGKTESIAIKDLDSDGIPEILSGGMNGPNASFLYVFKYNPTSKTFDPMAFTYPQNSFTRNFLVSDIFDPNSNDVIVKKDGKIRAAGKIYTKNGPVAGYYFFELKDGQYECTSIVPQSKGNSKNKKQ